MIPWGFTKNCIDEIIRKLKLSHGLFKFTEKMRISSLIYLSNIKQKLSSIEYTSKENVDS